MVVTAAATAVATAAATVVVSRGLLKAKAASWGLAQQQSLGS